MEDPTRSNKSASRGAAPGDGRAGEIPADIDISLVEDSLRLTPWQRLIENERALALVRMLEKARLREDGTS